MVILVYMEFVSLNLEFVSTEFTIFQCDKNVYTRALQNPNAIDNLCCGKPCQNC